VNIYSKIFTLITISFLCLSGCATSASPSGFYDYAERKGKQVDSFNPCINGVEDRETRFRVQERIDEYERSGYGSSRRYDRHGYFPQHEEIEYRRVLIRGEGTCK
jgi:hypothetical protein